mmetsp:Transcript_16905/g.59112  ORF Transcript_16905/g.59112 Transcript_16905/m.59112 type:complete len:689 (-) Transcript_16905:185-2251(-)
MAEEFSGSDGDDAPVHPAGGGGAGDGAGEGDGGGDGSDDSYGDDMAGEDEEEAVFMLGGGDGEEDDDEEEEEMDPRLHAYIMRQLYSLMRGGGAVGRGLGRGPGGARFHRGGGGDDEEEEEGGEGVAGTGRHRHEFEQAEALRTSEFALAVHAAAGDTPHPRSTAAVAARLRRRASSVGSEASAGAPDGDAGGAGARSLPHSGPPHSPILSAAGAPLSPAAADSAAGRARAVNVSRTRHHVAHLLSSREMGHNGAVGWRSPERVAVSQRVLPNALRPERLMTEIRSRVYSGQFSVDGALFCGATQSDVLQVYDTTSSAWAVHKSIETQGVRWTVSSTDFSPDSHFIIYSTLSDTLHMCNVFGEYEIHEPLVVDTGGGAIYSAQFSAGGTEVCCGSSHALSIFDVERKATVERVNAHDDDINSVCYLDLAFRPYLIATGSDDHLIKVWDRRTMGSGKPAGVLPGHAEGITKVASKGDGVHLLSNGKDQTARLWDIRKMYTADEARKLPRVPRRFEWDYRWGNYPGVGVPYKHPHDKSILIYRGHQVTSTLIRAYFSPAATTGQRYVYTGSADGNVYIYDALTAAIVARLVGHNALVRDVSWHPHEPILCSSSWDGTIGVWDHQAGAGGEDERASRRPHAELYPDGLEGFAYRRAEDDDASGAGDGAGGAGGAGGEGGAAGGAGFGAGMG